MARRKASKSKVIDLTEAVKEAANGNDRFVVRVYGGYVKREQDIPESWFSVVHDKKCATIFSGSAVRNFVRQQFKNKLVAVVEPA